MALNGNGFAVKPGCVNILPLTPPDRPSTFAELVKWCNTMAKAAGVHDDPASERHNPINPGYHCTVENFGR